MEGMTCRILVVDDEPDIAMSLKVGLTKKGFDDPQ